MIVNGKEMIFEKNVTINGLLEAIKVNRDSVVVEVSGVIVPKEKFEGHLLNHEDKIEIVSFLGGG